MTSTSVFDGMTLEQLEEVSGELQRRAGAALRRIGEARADERGAEGDTARERLTRLIASSELAIATLAAAAARTDPPRARLDQNPTALTALMYGAPTLAGLLGRLEQDRRILASLARTLEPRLDDVVRTAWGEQRLRQIVVRHAIEEPARHAQSFEAQLADLDAIGPDDAHA